MNFNIFSMDKEHMYKLITDTMVPLMVVLYLYKKVGMKSQLFFLGDAQKEAITFFSNTKLSPAYAALLDLEATLKVFPENTKLAELLPEWKKIEKQKKEISDYKYVEGAWENIRKLRGFH